MHALLDYRIQFRMVCSVQLGHTDQARHQACHILHKFSLFRDIKDRIAFTLTHRPVSFEHSGTYPNESTYWRK